MTYSKSQKFNLDLQELSNLAKVLSHPARLAILKHLAQTKSCISGDIAKELPLSRTTVSQHLQSLKKAGLIKGNIAGLNVCYCINPEKLAECKSLFQQFFEDAETDISCC